MYRAPQARSLTKSYWAHLYLRARVVHCFVFACCLSLVVAVVFGWYFRLPTLLYWLIDFWARFSKVKWSTKYMNKARYSYRTECFESRFGFVDLWFWFSQDMEVICHPFLRFTEIKKWNVEQMVSEVCEQVNRWRDWEGMGKGLIMLGGCSEWSHWKCRGGKVEI